MRKYYSVACAIFSGGFASAYSTELTLTLGLFLVANIVGWLAILRKIKKDHKIMEEQAEIQRGLSNQVKELNGNLNILIEKLQK